MAAPIQIPTKCELLSVIRFVNAKGERPAEIHKQIVAVYGNVMNRQKVTKWCREFCEGRTDVHDEQRSGRPSLISDDLFQEIEGEIRADRRVTIRELHHIIPEASRIVVLDVTINSNNLFVNFRWTFTFCVEKSYDATQLAFGGTLDRRCHFKHASLKQSRFYRYQTSTAHT